MTGTLSSEKIGGIWQQVELALTFTDQTSVGRILQLSQP